MNLFLSKALANTPVVVTKYLHFTTTSAFCGGLQGYTSDLIFQCKFDAKLTLIIHDLKIVWQATEFNVILKTWSDNVRPTHVLAGHQPPRGTISIGLGFEKTHLSLDILTK